MTLGFIVVYSKKVKLIGIFLAQPLFWWNLLLVLLAIDQKLLQPFFKNTHISRCPYIFIAVI